MDDYMVRSWGCLRKRRLTKWCWAVRQRVFDKHASHKEISMPYRHQPTLSISLKLGMSVLMLWDHQ